MTARDERPTEFEEQARAMLAESVTRIDGRIRSRLNQARQAAAAEVVRAARRPVFLRSFLIMPAGALAAAALVAMVFWQHQPAAVLPVSEGGTMAMEDMDLIADGDGLDMVEDSDGSFYEWAAAQADSSGETSS